jgi:asparagine synthase (glutamine-hydrolysing)
MCGIYGVVALGPDARLDAGWLPRMGRTIIHRGPDDEGAYSDASVLLGMRRLSIIDVSGGHQPIANEDGTVIAICNGEIYNFRQLRRDLQSRGHTFKTGSDTEVLVHLYEEHGEQLVRHIDGMYGFAVWDTKRRRLLVGRDRIGIKPIYYWSDGKRLAFASEAKSLFEVPGVSAGLDTAALHDYLSLGYVCGERSLFAGIKRLPTATLLQVDERGVTQQRYWTLPAGTDRSMTEAQWSDAVRARMEAAVTEQMVSDVPLGAFLSGGLDSSAVVALMAKHSDRPVNTYSIGFRNSSGAELFNELPAARSVAERFGTRHREIVVMPDVVSLLPQLVWHMDEPMADSASFTTYLVSKFAREDVKVILSGVGGDEIFGGYNRYLGEHYRRFYNVLPQWFRSGVLAPLARHLPSDRHSKLLNVARYAKRFILANELGFHERYRTFLDVFGPQQLAAMGISRAGAMDAVAKAFAEVKSEEPLRQLAGVDFATQLPDDLLLLTDKMTMATSIECRVPLLDVQLVELAARMPADVKIKGGRLKSLMKRAVSDLLPQEIIDRPKRGFGAPIGAWLRSELSGVTQQLLSPESVSRRGLFPPAAIAEIVGQHQVSREDHTEHLMALINLELWCRIFLDKQSPADVAESLVPARAA